MNNRRVVIAGVGVLSSIGVGKDEFWNNLVNGVSGAGEVEGFDLDHSISKKACALRPFDAKDFYPSNSIRRVDRFSILGMIAAKLAYMDAGSYLDHIEPHRKGSILTTIWGAFKSTENYFRTLIKDGPLQVSPMIFSSTVANSPGGYISKHLNLKGVSSTLSGGSAISYAYNLIRHNKADIVLAGGIEDMNEVVYKAFSHHNMLARRNGDIDENSRPFDQHRNGFMIGEGSVILVLEELEHALKNKANIYAEIVGDAVFWDQFNERTINIGSENIEESVSDTMRHALASAKISPSEVDFICSMANSTQIVDYIESYAIKRVFNNKSKEIYISAPKSILGETFGVSTSLAVAVTALALRNSQIPPTINQITQDQQCDINCVRNKAVNADINIALANSFEIIGGNITSIVLKKYN